MHVLTSENIIFLLLLPQLLDSSMVSTRIYSNQMEQLLQLYQAYAVGGRMRLEEFVPVAKTSLLMIYQNAYPDVVREI